MAGTNKIYQFGGSCEPPYVQTDEDYEDDAMRTAGWQPGIVRQDFLNKVDRQGNSMAAGLGQFIADNIPTTDDIVDTLTPAQIAALLLSALSNALLTTQPQFDASQKPANTEFVQRALGSLSAGVAYGVNTNLTAADIGKMVLPTSGGLGFGLPLIANVANGSQIRFNGNSHGCVISRQGSDIINNGTDGTISTLSLLEYDVIEFTALGGIWCVTGGNEQLNTSTQFEQSLTTNGWAKLPGGRIEQWGIVGVASGGQTVPFHFAFPTACLNVMVCDGGSGGGGAYSANAHNPTTTGFYGEMSTPGGGAGAGTLSWRATGH